MLSAPILLGQSARDKERSPRPPAAPAGFIWICVSDAAWRQLRAALAALGTIDRAA